MVLCMARPFKHPKTGMYWLRRRVPADLIALVGKREELLSLKTKDASEAKRLHAAALAELEARWDQLRAGTVKLSEREALEIARDLFDRWIELHRDEPSQQTRWRTNLFGMLWRSPTAEELSLPLSAVDMDGVKRRQMEALAFEGADALLQRRGLVTDGESRSKLARAVAAILQRASLALEAQARGDLGVTFASDEGSLPTAAPAPSERRKALTFDDALKLWTLERRPRDKTQYEWRRVMNEFAAFVGHRQADRLTPDDFIRWKQALLEAGRSTKTIRDAKLAPMRAILQVAVENRRLSDNPAEKVTVTVKKVAAEARRDFTEEEAVTVLKAAALEKKPVLRWVPWLCAYSGARVSEVCQLRREDVYQQEGIWVMRFSAEAGDLKTANSERIVPLHAALIASGFLTFADKTKTGPLFADVKPDVFGRRGGNGLKVIGRWVRDLGLTDPRLAPNHSWRHRFKTMGRRYDLRLDIVDAMVGHAPNKVGDRYGAHPVTAMLREMEKIPSLVLEPS